MATHKAKSYMRIKLLLSSYGVHSFKPCAHRRAVKMTKHMQHGTSTYKLSEHKACKTTSFLSLSNNV